MKNAEELEILFQYFQNRIYRKHTSDLQILLTIL